MSTNDFQLVSHSKARRRARDEVDMSNIIIEKRQRIASAKVCENAEAPRKLAPIFSANCFEVLSDSEDNADVPQSGMVTDIPTEVSEAEDGSNSCNSCFETQESSSDNKRTVRYIIIIQMFIAINHSIQ